jgi:Ca2+-binding RTX toxin-like protein
MCGELEQLENRRLYSVSATLAASGVLTIAGTGGNDNIYINRSASGITVYDQSGSNLKWDFTPGLVKKMKVDLGAGNDQLFIGMQDAIPSTIKGGDGDDNITAGKGNDQIDAGAGDDTINGAGGNDYIDAGAGDDGVGGAEGNDTLVGGDGNDLITGGLDNDLIDGGLGADRIRGSEGSDTVTYATRTSDVAVDLSDDPTETADDGEVGEGDFVEADVENIIGGAGNDTLLGSTLAPNAPSSYTVNNMIWGGDGNDKIQGLDGNDVLDGGAGNDSIGGNAGRDRIYGGLGNDTIRGHGGNDLLYGQAHIDKIWGGDGNDYIDGGTSNDRLQGDTGDDTIVGGLGDDHVYAKNDGGADSIDGNDGFDDIRVDVLDIYKNCEDIGY